MTGERGSRGAGGAAGQALSVLNGMLGDLLEDRQSSLAIPMSFRCDGAELRLDREALAEELPGATGSVCLFVPGLMGTDAVWRFPGPAGATYGSRLAADRNVTPVFLSYNSGRHVSGNGRQLALLLHALVAAWPVELEELSLVGHSMGGLVVRSACHYGALEGCPWVEKVRRVFLLGAPLSGAPLEKLVHVADFTLTTIWNPVTRFIGRALRRRSAGIKDLRFGALVEEDWSGHDPDELRWPRRQPVPLLRTADHYVIAGSLAGRIDHPAARVLGDPLVTFFSATGQTLAGRRATPFRESHVRNLPKLGHLALAHDDTVYEQMLAWWNTP
ncbi:MAG TPA: alpha/beta hydrolase [Acidimicrobiia bacterium]|nr:alpha/beta hydrolase [Acidimicrobiia bacterium]